jgi:hypothetical protein
MNPIRFLFTPQARVRRPAAVCCIEAMPYTQHVHPQSHAVARV